MALVVGDNKRKPDDIEQSIAIKRARTEIIDPNLGGINRTSALQAPIMVLSGHQAEVFAVRFNPSGKTLASCSFDKEIFLWHVYGDCVNYAVLKGHIGAVLEVQWTTSGEKLVSASTDKTVHVWDGETGKRVKRLREHTGIVNSVCPAKKENLLVSGSDDATARVWDVRMRNSVQVLHHKFPITSVAFGESSDQVYTGGLDNDIRVWDLRKNDVLFSLKGHTDTVTGLRLSPDGSYLLSNAMDNSVRIWDIRPYVAFQRCVKIFQGVQHNFEKNLLRCSWSPDGSRIAAGSADRLVNVWDTTTRQILYKLPGHNGSVNDIDFHPTEPIIASCSSDRMIYLGEISPP